MNETLSDADLLRLRMRALGLSGTAHLRPGAAGAADPADRVAAVAEHLFALQGQDWRASRWAIGARAPILTGGEVSLSDIADAFNSGRIVRSWPMRGTVHLISAADIGWLQSLTGRAPLAGAAKRRQFLGMSDEALERLVETSEQALAGGASLDRDELSEIWTAAGIEWQRNWRYHVIWWLCQNGIATFGPTDGQFEPRLVLAAEWIRDARTPENPLAELAIRYVSGRGAIGAKDLAWWSGLGVTEARRGLEAAVELGALVRVQRDGIAGAAGVLWADPESLDASDDDATRTGAARDWLLLPAFDEHLLGYTARDAQLDPEHFARIVPGRNGVFLATVVHEGRVVGTWKRASGRDGGIEVSPFPGQRIDEASLAPELARWSAFHGVAPGPIALV